MAYYNSENEDEDGDSSQGMNDAQAPQNGGQPVQLSSQSSQIGSGAPIPAAKQAKPATSGMGASFQNYAKANQGAASDKLNSSIAQNVTNQGQQAKTAVNQATQQFGTRVDEGSLANRQNAVQDVTNTTNAARKIAAGGAVDQTQQDRFSEVINSKYKGPESLRQAGLYQIASGKTDNAQNAINNTKTATGREDLLKGMHSQQGDYTTGINKLDSALLNASEQGVRNLQAAAKAQGNVQQQLDKAQVNSANAAQNRTKEISDIVEKSRQAFTGGKVAEEAATEKRLASVTKNWEQLPEYYRNIIRNKDKVNQEILKNSVNQYKTDNGYDNAQSRYNEAVTAQAGTKKALQQAELAKFGLGLSGSSIFGTPVGSGYHSPEQIAMIEKSLAKAQQDDRIAIESMNSRKARVDMQDKGLADINSKFNSDAVIFNPFEAATLGVQSGEGLYNLGANAIKSGVADKTRLISKDEQARQAALSYLAQLDQSDRLDTNLKYANAGKAGTQTSLDALDLAGTRKAINEGEKNFRSAADTKLTGVGSKKNKTNGKTYYAEESANLKDLLSDSGYKFDAPLTNTIGNKQLLNSAAKLSSGTVTQDPKGLAGAMDGYGGSISNMGNGQSLAQNGLDMFGTTGLNAITGALGMGSLGNAVSGLFGGGANTGASKSEAAGYARADLQNQIKENLASSGFQNRVAVANDKAVTSRQAALQKLLKSMDKTNVK